MKDDKTNETLEIQSICRKLTAANKKYVIGVANALAFTQTNKSTKPKKTA